MENFNVSSMRSGLEAARRWAESALTDPEKRVDQESAVYVRNLAVKALESPARNCDRFGWMAGEAVTEYLARTGKALSPGERL